MVAVAFPQVAQLPGAASASPRWSCCSIVPTSYRQTIHAYPNGGGAYVVSKENINRHRRPRRRRVAARRLHADGRGLDLLGRARHRLGGAVAPARRLPRRALPRVPRPHDGRQPARPQGGRARSSRSRPTSTSSLLFSLLVVGLTRVFALRPRPDRDLARAGRGVRRGARSSRRRRRLFVLLKAFSSGAVVLSGVEAISNGVPAFRKPESKNAATHAHLHGRSSSGVGFLGIGVLAHHLLPVVDEGGETVLSQMGKAVFGEHADLLRASRSRRSRS